MVGVLTAADLALAAKERRDVSKEQEKQAEARRKERDRLQHWRYMETVLDRARPTLSRWFPHVKWELYAPLMQNGIPSSDMTSPPQLALVRSEDQTVYLTLDPRGTEQVLIHVVEQRRDNDTGYNYWYGPEVKVPADIGEFLAARR